MEITNFSEARKALLKFVSPLSSMNEPYTLERMHALMDFLGNPQNKLKIVHVAGTSGKTSTAYYIAALLHETNAKVGLTVSPHVGEINERLQIDMVPMPEGKYCDELTEFMKLIKKSGIQPSYFECLVAMAYWEFAKQHVDYAVVEVGLGGLLDGTNVVNRTDKVCVITDIGLDHTLILGKTLEAIATQKAGIITKDNAVFTYVQGKGVTETIKNIAESKNAKLVLLKPSEVVMDTHFLPIFQQRNFTLAKAVADYVIRRDKLPALHVTQVLDAAHTYIPGRMEIFRHGGKTIIVDGAHNAQKLSALIASIEAQFPNQSVAALIGFVAGGEERLESAMSELASLTRTIIVTTFNGQQDTPKHSIDPHEVMAAAKGLDLDITVIEKPELALAALMAQPQPTLLVTGSFYLLNHIRPLMLKP